MITYLNQKFRVLLLFCLALVAISFIFFGNWSPSNGATQALGSIHGRQIQREDFLAAKRSLEEGTFFMTGGRVDMRRADNNDVDNQTWTRLVAIDAARSAGIIITGTEIRRAFEENPLLQENGRYSPERHKNYVDHILNPRGISEARFDDIIRDELMVRRIANLIASTAVVAPSEIESTYKDLLGPVSSLVRFTRTSYLNKVKATPEELQKFYDTHKSEYLKPEKRTVEYVKFILPPDQQKLEGDAARKALDVIGRKAFDFTSTVNPQEGTAVDFATAAKNAGLPISKTVVIKQQEKATDDPLLAPASVAGRAFVLTKDKSVSDFIEVEHGFIVMHLVDVTPAEPLAFEEVKTKVAQDYAQAQAGELLQQDGQKTRFQLAALLAEGKTWEQAVAKLGLQSVTVPTFVPATNTGIKIPEATIVGVLSSQLSEGTLSTFEPTATGGIILYISKKGEPEVSTRTSILPEIKRQLLLQRKSQVVDEWLITRMTSPGFQPPAGLIKDSAQEL